MPRDSLDSVYRLISSNRYLEAVNLINKILKKQPNFLVAKVWKCEVLYGLGNIRESEELMASIMEQAPTDKRTLDSIADFYRARGNYVKLVEVYENALKSDPNDENWRKALFECCGLAGDYKKQQQQALLLYKQSTRMLFYCMAVVCLLQQAEDNPVALELAERMMTKQSDAGKIKSRNEILLLINVLERRGKTEEALALLEKNASELDTLISVQEKRIELLNKLERWFESVKLLKERLREKPDSWLMWKQYFAAVLQLQASGGGADDAEVDDSTQRAFEFLKSLGEHNTHLRGPYIAEMELIKLTINSDDTARNQLCDLVARYFDKFGAKSISVFDLSQYIPLIDPSSTSELLAKISSPEHKELTALELQRRMGVTKHISFLQLSKLLGTFTSLSREQRERLCSDLEQCYRAAEGCDRREQYLLLLTHERSMLFKETGDAEHLILAVCELEDALVQGPIFAIQVLLLQLYFSLGASKAARKTYEQLRIQSVQVDTLVHIFLATISSTGHFSIANEMWETALKILQQCSAESLEALVWCYRAGLFHRVEEFTSCARRFQRSITVPLLRGEKTFLEIVMSGISRTEQALARIRPGVAWDGCVDNRDFRALPTWDPPGSHPQASQSYSELLLYCKIREATLFCLSAAISYGKQRREVEEKTFRSSVDKLQDLYANANEIQTIEHDRFGTGATRLHQIVQIPLPSLLEKLLEPDLISSEKICTMLKQVTDNCLEHIAFNKVRNPRLSLEVLVTEVEALAVLTVACGAAREELGPPMRRRSDQVLRALIACWTSLEGSLPAAQTRQSTGNAIGSTRDMVETKLRDSYQAASEDLRKVMRKKAAYLNKLISV